MAVAHADHILELQRDLSHEEMPPVWMWPFVKEMNEHINGALAKRRTPTPGSPSDDGMEENQLLRRD